MLSDLKIHPSLLFLHINQQSLHIPQKQIRLGHKISFTINLIILSFTSIMLACFLSWLTNTPIAPSRTILLDFLSAEAIPFWLRYSIAFWRSLLELSIADLQSDMEEPVRSRSFFICWAIELKFLWDYGKRPFNSFNIIFLIFYFRFYFIYLSF